MTSTGESVFMGEPGKVNLPRLGVVDGNDHPSFQQMRVGVDVSGVEASPNGYPTAPQYMHNLVLGMLHGP